MKLKKTEKAVSKELAEYGVYEVDKIYTLVQSGEVSASDVLVYNILSILVQDESVPLSANGIAKVCHMSHVTVRKSLKHLAELGLIEMYFLGVHSVYTYSVPHVKGVYKPSFVESMNE